MFFNKSLVEVEYLLAKTKSDNLHQSLFSWRTADTGQRFSDQTGLKISFEKQFPAPNDVYFRIKYNLDTGVFIKVRLF